MDSVQIENTERLAGLFLLNLQSESGGLMGAPTVKLSLTIDTVTDVANGLATVTQALEDPIVCRSHVNGPVIYEYTMDPESSCIRVDLTGYPEIHWPSGGGIGPVIPANFKAQILLSTNWQEGKIYYQYQTSTGNWVKEIQEIHTV